MGVIRNDSFYSSYLGDQIDLLLAAMAQANPLPSGTDWVAFIDDCRAAQSGAEAAAALAEAWSAHPPYIGQNGNWFVWNTTTNQYADSGVDASITVTIADVTSIASTATPYVTNTGTATDPIFHLFLPEAVSITGISKTSTSGLTDTYTITLSNGATATFSVVNGADGYAPVVTITPTSTGHSVTITDAQHPSGQTFNVVDGVDGVSPAVTVTTTTGGHRVTITDADHPSGQSFDVLDGEMTAAVYDPSGTVAASGGIPAYVSSNSPKPKVASVSLSTTWTGAGPYTQTVTVSGATPDSKIDLQPTAAQLQQLIDDGVQALYIENNAGTLTATAIGAAPTTAMTLQCTLTEVTA